MSIEDAPQNDIITLAYNLETGQFVIALKCIHLNFGCSLYSVTKITY